MSQLAPLTHPSLAMPHGFFTRRGGVSRGIYDSLNVGLGSDDARAAVLENRQRVQAHFAAQRLVTGHQTHSAITARVDHDTKAAPEADALVTTVPGLAIGVLSADCTPVLLADEHAGVIGAAHAGWRGAFDGILASVVGAMHAAGASQISAVIGPTISQAAYEVGPEFIARFEADYAADLDLFIASARDGHAMFDLPGFVGRQLARCGVTANDIGRCTYQNSAEFFSYRRTTHASEPDYGRQISAVCLPSD